MRLKQWQQSPESKKVTLEVNKQKSDIEGSRHNESEHSGLGKENVNSSQRTLFSEYETIDIAIKIIDLLEILHSNNIIHTNLNPENIFLLQGNSSKMCFQTLYHCSWKTQEILRNLNLGPDCEDNLSIYDIRTRNRNYVSPE